MRTYQETREEARRARVTGLCRSEREGESREGVREREGANERGRERSGGIRWYSFDFGRAAVVSSGNPTFHPVSYYPFRPSDHPSFDTAPRHHHSAYPRKRYSALGASAFARTPRTLFHSLSLFSFLFSFFLPSLPANAILVLLLTLAASLIHLSPSSPSSVTSVNHTT